MLTPLLLAAVLAGQDPNVARFLRVEGSGLAGTPAAVTDGVLCPEESDGIPGRSAILVDEGSVLVVPLGTVRRIRAVVIQCEADDDYLVERSLDGRHWSGLLHVRAAPHGAGLQTQAVDLPQPEPALFLAVHARGGNGHYAVSELQAFETLPAPWPPRVVARPKLPPPPRWADPGTVRLKGLLALAGALLLLARRGRALAALRGPMDAALVVAAALAFLGWWNFGHFHFERPLHVWDAFHYYVGAKYFPENGYSGIYESAVGAAFESGALPAGSPAVVRDLRSNDLSPVDPAAALKRARARFGAARWDSFVRDVAWFRSEAGAGWTPILQDHGFNGTPVWTLAGRLLSSTGAASAAQLSWLSAIDAGLLVAMWIAVFWAFGWETACVGLLFWGTWEPARYWWNGGSILRMDWLLASVLGVCLLRKGRPFAAGVSLAVAALLRVFPGVLLLGLAFAAAGRALRERRLRITAEEKRVVAGAVLAAALLVPASALLSGRSDVWPEFVANSRKHVATPLLNAMGLRTALSWSEETRFVNVGWNPGPEPWAEYKAHRREIAARRTPVRWAACALAAAAFAAAFWGAPAWVACAAAAGLMPVFTDLTCYYTSFLLLLALLASVRPGVGPLLALLGAVSCALPALLRYDDDRYALLSVLVLAVVTLAWETTRRALPPGGLNPIRTGSGPRPSPGSAPAPRPSRRAPRPLPVPLRTSSR